MDFDIKPIAPRTVCADGTTLSIQASAGHYCLPRRNEGPHIAKEVGFIRDKDGNELTPPESWVEHAGVDFPSDVYGWVPVELIEAFIADHGGRAA